MSKIFVSYRRSDSNPDASNIFNRLSQSYRRQRIEVSSDIGYIPAGADAEGYAQDRLRSYRALVVIIGPSWLKSANREGTRRLDIPTDLMRIEVASALNLNIPIVIVLVRQARVPEQSELPPPISGLAHRDAEDVIQFRGEPEFNADMRRLYKALEPKLSVQEQRVTPLVVDDSVAQGRVHELRDFRNAGRPPQRNFRLRNLGELNYVLHGRTGQLGKAADLSEVDLSFTNLTGADLSRVNLASANLAGANLAGANLAGADLREAKLQGANLTGAILREAQLGQLDLTDVTFDPKVISPKERIKVDLGDAHLEKAQLQRMDLKGTILAGANLAGADLSGADLRGVDLTAATLDQAILDHADLTGAVLTKAVLRSAHLSGTNVSGADLDGAILMAWA